KRKDFRSFACHRTCNWGVMQNHDPLWRPQLRHSAFQLKRFIDGRLHEYFDLSLAKGGQDTTSEAPHKSFGPGESHAVTFITGAIQHLDSGGRHHALQFSFLTAFVIVIAKHRDSGYA